MTHKTVYAPFCYCVNLAFLMALHIQTLGAQQLQTCPIEVLQTRWQSHAVKRKNLGETRSLLGPTTIITIKYRNVSGETISSMKASFQGFEQKTDVSGRPTITTLSSKILLKGLKPRRSTTDTADVSPALPNRGRVLLERVEFASGRILTVSNQLCSFQLTTKSASFGPIHGSISVLP